MAALVCELVVLAWIDPARAHRRWVLALALDPRGAALIEACAIVLQVALTCVAAGIALFSHTSGESALAGAVALLALLTCATWARVSEGVE